MIVAATLSPAGWTLVVVGVFVLVALVAILRIVTRDRRIRGVRVGVFYERDRDDWGDVEWDDGEARSERLARKEERPK